MFSRSNQVGAAVEGRNYVSRTLSKMIPRLQAEGAGRTKSGGKIMGDGMDLSDVRRGNL